eukprot:6319966-Pyramimonas_sp.AAC.1
MAKLEVMTRTRATTTTMTTRTWPPPPPFPPPIGASGAGRAHAGPLGAHAPRRQHRAPAVRGPLFFRGEGRDA